MRPRLRPPRKRGCYPCLGMPQTPVIYPRRKRVLSAPAEHFAASQNWKRGWKSAKRFAQPQRGSCGRCFQEFGDAAYIPLWSSISPHPESSAHPVKNVMRLHILDDGPSQLTAPRWQGTIRWTLIRREWVGGQPARAARFSDTRP